MKLAKFPRYIWYGVICPLLLGGVLIWRVWPKFEDYMARDERNAMNGLQQLGMNQVLYREIDWDKNKVNDFWTGDVAGLGKIRAGKVQGIGEADSILLLIAGMIFAAPLLAALTSVNIHPYRYVPMIVFFAIGIGTLFSKRSLNRSK